LNALICGAQRCATNAELSGPANERRTARNEREQSDVDHEDRDEDFEKGEAFRSRARAREGADARTVRSAGTGSSRGSLHDPTIFSGDRDPSPNGCSRERLIASLIGVSVHW
jgi:hypothetical protein